MCPLKNIYIYAREIINNGPTNLLIEENKIIPFKKHKEIIQTNQLVFFLREDGWSLGVEKTLENSAFELFKNSWVAKIESDKIILLKEKKVSYR